LLAEWIRPAQRADDADGSHEPEALLPGDYTMQLVVNGSLLCFTGKEAGQDVATSERVPFRIIK